MMKKLRNILLISLTLMGLSSCGSDSPALNVSTDQLEGLWLKKGSQEYWRYRADGTGVTWDEADDISEEESNLTFTFTINGARLTHIFTGEMGNQAVPKVYDITEITETTMLWKDDYSMTYRFTKQ